MAAKMLISALHLVNGLGQAWAAASTVSPNVVVSGEKVAIYDRYGETNQVAHVLVTTYVGPLSMGVASLASLAALVCGETNSKAVLLLLVYYHSFLTFRLYPFAKRGTPWVVSDDTFTAVAYHGTMAVLFTTAFVSTFLSAPSSSNSAKKNKQQ